MANTAPAIKNTLVEILKEQKDKDNRLFFDVASRYFSSIDVKRLPQFFDIEKLNIYTLREFLPQLYEALRKRGLIVLRRTQKNARGLSKVVHFDEDQAQRDFTCPDTLKRYSSVEIADLIELFPQMEFHFCLLKPPYCQIESKEEALQTQRLEYKINGIVRVHQTI